MDFMYDELTNGRAICLLNEFDDFNRAGLAIEVDMALPAARVIRTLDRIIESQGRSKVIRCDNGSEYTSGKLIS